MTHLPFILGSYAVFAGAVIVLIIGANLRLHRVTARLRAVDPRANPQGTPE